MYALRRRSSLLPGGPMGRPLRNLVRTAVVLAMSAAAAVTLEQPAAAAPLSDPAALTAIRDRLTASLPEGGTLHVDPVAGTVVMRVPGPGAPRLSALSS